MSTAPSIDQILAEPSRIPPEDVIKWRGRVGGELAKIWGKSPERRGNHLQIIFGNLKSNRPLATPLFEAVTEQHDADIEMSALELWEQMWKDPHPQIMDFDASMQQMRIVVVTSTPVSQGLIQELLEEVRDNVARDLPDYLLTA